MIHCRIQIFITMGTIYKTNGFLHVILVNNCQRIPKGQSQMDNSEKVSFSEPPGSQSQAVNYIIYLCIIINVLGLIIMT
jgi:hypothetical protein